MYGVDTMGALHGKCNDATPAACALLRELLATAFGRRHITRAGESHAHSRQHAVLVSPCPPTPHPACMVAHAWSPREHVHANLAAAAPPQSSFQTVIWPGFPGYALYPSARVDGLETGITGAAAAKYFAL